MRNNNRSRRGLLVTVFLLLGLLMSISTAMAHTGGASVTCSKVNIDLTSYNGTNHITVTAGSETLVDTNFGNSYSASLDLPAHTADITVVVDVDAHDDPNGTNGWSFVQTLTAPPCETVTPPPTEETPEVTETPTAPPTEETPEVTETPTAPPTEVTETVTPPTEETETATPPTETETVTPPVETETATPPEGTDESTPDPDKTATPPTMNGGHVCWFMLGGGPNNNPFGGQPWGNWVDTGATFSYILVSYKDIPATDPTGPRTGWEVSLQTDDDSRREGQMTITGPNDFSVTGDVAQNYCNFPWNDSPVATPRPVPDSGASDLPAGRGGTNNLPVVGIVLLLCLAVGGGSMYHFRSKFA